MMKKYIADSVVSLSASLANGNSVRLSFSSLSNGSSVYYTSDQDIQWALEHHYKFGKLFRVVEEMPDKKPVVVKKNSKKQAKPIKADKKSAKPVTNASCEEASVETLETSDEIDMEEAEDEPQNEEASEYREVVVSDMEAAKDYLAEKFEVVRTKLKTEDKIKETALAFGIVFKYL